jgi:hypothetical protein
LVSKFCEKVLEYVQIVTTKSFPFSQQLCYKKFFITSKWTGTCRCKVSCVAHWFF